MELNRIYTHKEMHTPCTYARGNRRPKLFVVYFWKKDGKNAHEVRQSRWNNDKQCAFLLFTGTV